VSGASADRPALLFYCQHSVGLGHLVRSFALARAFAERFRVVLLCGGELPPAPAPPDGVEIVPLPPLGVNGNGEFGSRDHHRSTDDARAARRRLILEAFHSLRPDAVVIELFPFGRAKFAAELLPLLEAARAQAEPPLVACSLRDILVTGREDQRAYDERACALANRWFDAVLVHSDPRVVRLEDSFALRGRLRVPVRYTGFVLPGAGPSPLRRERRLVVSVGGGRVGEPLLSAAVAAHQHLFVERGVRTKAIAGPFLPADAWERLAHAARDSDAIELVRHVPDLGAELRSAAASISQCGYNTALELIDARVPALVVPFATPEEDEQLARARRLEELGAVRVLDPVHLDAEVLAEAALALLDFEPSAPAVDLDGAAGSVRLIAELVATADTEAAAR
jgi:predicted glycosyltransferase